MEISQNELQQWQLWSQHLTSPAESLQVGADLCGLQAQYAGNAIHSLRIRSKNADTTAFVKSWTLRGTLHLFPLSDLPLYHSPTDLEDIFQTPYGKWLYDGHCSLPQERMLFFAHLVADALSETPVSRDDLRTLCLQAGMSEIEEAWVFSGWGGIIRLLAECGVLYISATERHHYLRCPHCPSIPREQAELELLRRYLTHYGPVTLHDAMYFFRWSQKKLRDLMAQLPVQTLTMHDRTYYYIVQPDVLPPLPRCVFLAGFDPLMLGYEKKESLYLPPAHLKRIFNNTGIVFPALLLDGQVKGKWKEQPRRMEITLFEPLYKTEVQILEQECDRLWPNKALRFL